jgi:FAD/FMN-containing dehydrogenase
MQKTTSPSRRRRWQVAFLLLVSLLVVAAKKFFDYSAAPAKEKESDFVYPPNAGQTKPTTLVLEVPPAAQLPFEQVGGYINDASHLNKTAVYGIVKVTTVQDIQNAVQFARDHKLKVTAAGSRHSMGGHTFVKDGLVLDMRGFNQVRLDKEHKILNVQTGATWKQLQLFLDPYGLAIKAMQSINIFTVGGTLSVNAHGIAHNPGQVAPTVRSFRILLSDGEIKNCSPAENSELFHHALGGYGLMGVILDVDLDVVENEMYVWKTHYLDYKDFASYYQKNVDGNPGIGLAYGRLSMSPSTFLSETAIHTYEKTHTEVPVVPLKLPGYVWLDRFIINFSKTGDFGRRVRWTMEKYGEPRLHNCLSRNEAMSREEGCFVSRNQEMYDSMDYLENRLKDTDILQEYFIPRDKMPQFVDGLRTIVKGKGANLINVTIRIVHKDDITTLNYAKQDMFAYVLYFNQKFNEREGQVLQKTTTDLIDLALHLDGTYYLPYQLFYSKEQLRRAYPRIDEFFAAKKTYDPGELFTNKFYEKYGRVAVP